MPTRLATTIRKIDSITNRANLELVRKFYDFMGSNDASEHHQNINLKDVTAFANFLGEKIILQISIRPSRVIELSEVYKHEVLNAMAEIFQATMNNYFSLQWKRSTDS